MNDLDLLTRLRAELPEPEPLALQRIRYQVLSRTGLPRRSRRLVLRAGLATGLVGVLGGGVLMTDSLTRAATDPAAAAELNAAADRAIGQRDPVIRPGQYRYVRIHAWYGTTTGYGDRMVTYQTEQRYESWVPADQTQLWYWRYTRPLSVRFASKADEDYIRAVLPPDALRPRVELYRGAGGAMEPVNPGPKGDPKPAFTPGWQTPNSAWLATLPRDPGTLLRRIYTDSAGQGRGRDSEAFVFVGDVLRSGLVPVDLRAALFRATAMIPGVRLIDRAANLDGKVGIAVGIDHPEGTRSEIIFDPRTGQVIGERDVAYKRLDSYRPGDVMGSTAVTVQVVDKPGF